MTSSHRLLARSVALLCLVSLVAACRTEGVARIELVAGDVGGRGWLDGRGDLARLQIAGPFATLPDGTAYVAAGAQLRSAAPPAWRRIAPDGTVATIQLGTLATQTDAEIDWTAIRPGAMDADAQGNLYLSDPEHHRLLRIDAKGRARVLAGVADEAGEADGAQARLNFPGDVDAGPRSSVYFVDAGSGSVRHVDAEGMVTTVYRGAARQASAEERLARPIPAQVAAAPDGSAWVLGEIVDHEDGSSRRTILHLAANGEVLRSLDAIRKWDDDGREDEATGAPFVDPRDLDVDGAGVVWVTEGGAGKAIRQILPDGSVARFAHPRCVRSDACTPDPEGSDYRDPLRLSIGAGGAVRLYSDSAVYGVDAARKVVPLAGREPCTGTQAAGAALGCAPIEAFALRHDGDLVASTLQGTYRIGQDGTVTPLSREVRARWHPRLARCLGAHDAGDGARENLLLPWRMAFARDGTQFAHYDNQLVRIDANGRATIVADWGLAFAACPKLRTPFEPQAILAGEQGQLYVADYWRAAVYEVDRDARVRVVAGTPQPHLPDDPPARGPSALNRPTALALDRDGALLIGDVAGIHRVEQDGSLHKLVALGESPPCACGTAPQAMAVHANGDVWFATHFPNVLSRFVRATGKTESIAGRPDATGNRLGVLPASLGEVRGMHFTDKGLYLASDFAVLRIVGLR